MKAWLLLIVLVSFSGCADGEGNGVFRQTMGSGAAPGRLDGAGGTWTLAVDFQDASGTARIVLWG